MELQTFYFNRPKELRTHVQQDGSIWFVAKDVCQMLELDDTSKAIQNLDSDEKGTNKVPTLGGEQEMSIISESGLYTLIIRSNKPQAKEFRRWVTHEVLPSIRKTGSYGAKDNTGRRIPNRKPLQWDLIQDLRSKMIWGDIALMSRELGLDKKRIQNLLNGRIRKPNSEVLQKVQTWISENRSSH